MKTAALTILCATALVAQEKVIGMAEMGLANGIRVHITSKANAYPERWGGQGVKGLTGNSFQRDFSDRDRLLFAYVLQVDRLPNDKSRVSVRIKPAPAPWPTFDRERELPLLGFGDRATLEVLSNPTTGEKITDTIEVNEGPIVVKLGTSEYAMNWFRPSVLIDGNLVAKPSHNAMQGSGIMMFFAKDYGSYFFSTKPVAGWAFAKIANVRGGVISFQLNNRKHEVISEGPILPEGRDGELWVYHDPRRPTWKWDRTEDFYLAAADTMETFYPTK